MKPILDPARDLAGATPETLALALLTMPPKQRLSRRVREAVVGDEVPVEEPVLFQVRAMVGGTKT